MGKVRRHLPTMLSLVLALSRPALIMAQTLTPTTSAPTSVPTPAPVAITEAPTKVPTAAPITDSPTLAPITATVSPTVTPITGTPTATPITAAPTATPITAAPTVTPTKATLSPTTAAPTKATPLPTTAAPTKATPLPTTAAPTKATPLPTTAAPTTSKPTHLPTPKPTSSPTKTPTHEPSASPTTLKPTSFPSVSGNLSPTSFPSSIPSIITETPSISSSPSTSSATHAPSQLNSINSSGPTYKVATTRTGLAITLSGINDIGDTKSWAKTTGKFYVKQLKSSGKMFNVESEVIFTNQTSGSGGRRMRGLQSESVTVTYKQPIIYFTSDSSLTVEEALKWPLETQAQQDLYVAALKQLDPTTYRGLTSVSTIYVPDNIKPSPAPDTGGGGLPQWAVIVIVIAGVLVLVSLFLVVIRKSRSDRSDGNHTQESNTYQQSGFGSSSVPPMLGDETVETMDYDYAKAYGGLGAGDASLSEAGGTMGSRAAPQSGNTIFSDDPTFNEAYDAGREEVIDVFAPPGKLGVVIDTPDDNAPVVHAVKDSSPIVDQVKVGDKLVAVDDEDVRHMTAIKVSKLISKKSSQETRKLTIIRHVAG